MTIGEALDSRKDCNEGKWNSSKDDRGRVIVEYICKFPQVYLDTFRDSVAKIYNINKLTGNSTNKIAILSEHKDDIQDLYDYISANYDSFTQLNNIDAEALKLLDDVLWNEAYHNHGREIANLPDKNAVCQKITNVNISCDDYYNHLSNAYTLLNNYISLYAKKKSIVPAFQLPQNEDELPTLYPNYDHDTPKNFIALFHYLVPKVNGDAPPPKLSEIKSYYNALIPKFNSYVDGIINNQDKHNQDKLKNYERVISSSTYNSIHESISWFVNSNGIPELKQIKFITDKDSVQQTIQVPDRDIDNVLSLAYQNIPQDKTPTIYMDSWGSNLIGVYYFGKTLPE